MLPKEFKDRMRAIMQDDAERLFDVLESADAIKAFRVNGVKCDASSFEASGAAVDRDGSFWMENAYYTKEKYPGSLPEHHAGAIYIQDPAAMATVAALDNLDGLTVLDCCAAPGGKTGQLSAAVGPEGLVFANEYEPARAKILYSNLERLGCTNVIATNVDTSTYRDEYKEYFDVVLCDAPCSGEGMFRKNERAIEEWSVENVLMCAERQREILSNVVCCLKRGGRLLYSTCTFSLEENEMNVAWLLDSFGDLELADVPEALRNATSDGVCYEGCNYDMTKTRRCYPHTSKGEGQFIALLRRKNYAEVGSDGGSEDGIENGGKYEASKLEGETLVGGSCRSLDEKKAVRKAEKHSKKDKKASKNDKNINGKSQNKQNVELIELGKAFLQENLVCVPNGDFVVLCDKLWLCPSAKMPSHGMVAAGVCLGEAQKGRFVPHHQLFSAFGNLFLRRLCLSFDSPLAATYLFGEELSINDIALATSDVSVKCKQAERRDDRRDCYFAPENAQNGWAAVILGGCASGGVKISNEVAKNHYPKGLRNKRIG